LPYNWLVVIDVLHISKLANLTLNDKEIKLFEKQLSSVLDYIQKLQQVNTDNIGETSQITGLVNITRKDENTPSLQQPDAIANGKKIHNGLFEVNAILEQ